MHLQLPFWRHKRQWGTHGRRRAVTQSSPFQRTLIPVSGVRGCMGTSKTCCHRGCVHPGTPGQISNVAVQRQFTRVLTPSLVCRACDDHLPARLISPPGSHEPIRQQPQ